MVEGSIIMNRCKNKEKLDSILEKHRLWRCGKEGGERANLIKEDLSGASLSGANLSGAYLTQANLSEAKLVGADLSGAYLIGADLRRARLIKANLSGASLSDANLSGAYLTQASLIEAKLVGANLSEANLVRADLIRADLSEANLSDAKLNILCADFVKGADLQVISMGLRHRMVRYENTVTIGCLSLTIDYWLENFKTIGRNHNYSEVEIRCYEAGLLCMAATYDLKQQGKEEQQ